MVDFSAAIAAAESSAMETWFSPGVSDSVALNGTPIQANIIGYGLDEEGRAQGDSVDVMFKVSDAPVLTFRDSTVIIDGVTWRYPKLITGDRLTVTYRFRNNERPLAR